MEDPRLAYVIGAWFGGRRMMDAPYQADRLCYVREHLRRLLTLKCDLISKFVIGYPDDDPSARPPDEIHELISEARSKAHFDIDLMRRPANVGMGFGTWVDAMVKYGDQFDGYFLLEDDYAYCLDNFDRIVYDISCKKRASYVNGYGYINKHGYRLASPSGLIQKKAVKLVSKFMKVKFKPRFWKPEIFGGGVYLDRLVTYWSWAFTFNKFNAINYNDQYGCKCRFPDRFVTYGEGHPVLFESICC